MSEPLNAGDLTTRIRFGYIGESSGPLGEPLPGVFVHVGGAWVKAEPISHKKIRTADQEPVVETWQLTTHPRKDIAAGWKVIIDGVSHSVRNVNRSERDRIVITTEVDPEHDRVSD